MDGFDSRQRSQSPELQSEQALPRRSTTRTPSPIKRSNTTDGSVAKMSAQKIKLLQLRDSLRQNASELKTSDKDSELSAEVDILSTRKKIMESLKRSPLKLYDTKEQNSSDGVNGEPNLLGQHKLKLDSFQAKRVIEDVKSPVKSGYEKNSKKLKTGYHNNRTSTITGETSFGSPRGERRNGEDLPYSDLLTDIEPIDSIPKENDKLMKINGYSSRSDNNVAKNRKQPDDRNLGSKTKLNRSSSVSRIPKSYSSTAELNIPTPSFRNSKIPSLTTAMITSSRKPTKVSTISSPLGKGGEDDNLSLVDVDVTEHLPSKSKSAPKYTSQSDIERLKAQHRAETISLKAKLSGRDAELSSLKQELINAEQQIASHDAKVTDIVNRVAKQLHTQYSEKHQAKVNSLKVLYDEKYQAEITQLNDRIKTLEEALDDERQQHEQELNSVKAILKEERSQHSQMVIAFEEYLSVKGDDLHGNAGST